MAKSSLEKSHSKASNFKLTLLCLLTIVFFAVLWCGLIQLKRQETIALVITIVGAVGTVLCLALLNAFSRG
ncbi:MAG: hypothetical protein J6Y28_03760 [Acholeplasmatales bacterium]|nr:hypothetical protein [Acholeplasmatales bacterium]